MSKTNHQRNFKDEKDPKRYSKLVFKGGELTYSELSDKFICAKGPIFEFTNGHRGHAKNKRGMKKFVNSRIRFNENQALKKIVGEFYSE